MNDYMWYLVPYLIIVPFVTNKVLALIFLISYQYFIPDYWQLWFVLFLVSMITTEATKG